ncbi:Gfo/Idh/MocA family oxidoreductase [Stutzerimonas azotifigens]|uniref:Gfo/Idh/MocA family oxidoreductase n=1 Tax=Stutzerimonas azotifigens TaxID=291995 RepID=UPI000405A622|nr:Gfo/Idh/MocA family oxidoreductase [Stutzerimonas azotifigens]
MPVESPPLRIALVGEGAMGHTHAEVLASLPGAALQALVARDLDAGRALAQKWSIPHCSDDYAACLASGEVDAVVIASPSALHVEHGLMAAQAGLPCLIEIPAALDLAGAEALGQAQRRSGQVMMVAHSRRFSPAHRWLKSRIQVGTFQLHHLVAETYFLRRSNLNMFGQPRTWTDNLLWHHACHSVDLFAWLLESEDFDVQAQQGPVHPVMGIPMDMSIGLRERRTGQLLTLALSFNNKGPFGGFYRYIGEQDTYRAFRDELSDGEGQPVPLEGAAFASQDAEFVEAVRTGRTPESDIHSILPGMRLLQRIQRCLG